MVTAALSMPTLSPTASSLFVHESCAPRKRPFEIANPCGRVIAASFGVRGLLLDLEATSPLEGMRLLRELFPILRASGLGVIQALVSTEPDPLTSTLEAVGFKSVEDPLYIKQLTGRYRVDILPAGYHIRAGTVEDLMTRLTPFTGSGDQPLKEWERSYLITHLRRSDHPPLFKLLEWKGSIVGIALGGNHQEIGRLSHFWIQKEHRTPLIEQTFAHAAWNQLFRNGSRIFHVTMNESSPEIREFVSRNNLSRSSDLRVMEMVLAEEV